MAGCGCAAGPAPEGDVQHQPPCYPNLTLDKLGYPNNHTIIWDILPNFDLSHKKTGISQHILSYPKILMFFKDILK